jgi:sigma-B regulation protein RsbU (phosphoserine phosphatase)
MATTPLSPAISDRIPVRISTSCEFVQVLMKLQRAAELITSTLDLDSLLDRVVNDLGSTIGNVEVTVWLRDFQTDDLVLEGVRGCTVHKKGARLKTGVEGMVGYVAATGKTRYARDVRIDPYYLACEPETRSSLNVPLKTDGQVVGVLCIDHDCIDGFSEDQIQVLEALAGHTSVAIENARRFQRERVAREKIHNEVEQARAIQQALIPNCIPLIPGFAFETSWEPAGLVAGDWFDFIDLGDGRLGIVVADASGKGIAGAMLMSSARSLLRFFAKDCPCPAETLRRLNNALLGDMPSAKFVTALYGVLDSNSRELTLASAGHPRPLLVNGDCRFVDMDPGLPLGLITSSYPEQTIKLPPGTRLLLYTDGITEAMSSQDEEYGPGRLMQHFLRPDACVKALIDEVQRFSGGLQMSDDATAVLIHSR